MERDAGAGAGVQRGQDASNTPPSATTMEAVSQQRQLQQHYPHSTNGLHPEAYRESSHSLPPLHSYSEAQTAMQQPHYAEPMNGAQLQQPSYNLATATPQYQYQNGTMQPAPMLSNGNGRMMRYPIPQAPLDARQMLGVRGKKEIKRRTKTGCLTCRKRRIKCDEGQPFCRNCAKSKRECLRYDPIFKQQTGPAPIQPAPAARSAVPTTKPTATSPFPTNPFQTPHEYSATAGAYASAHSYDGPAEYATSLDPALGSGEPPHLAMAHNNYHSNLQPERRVRSLAIDDLFSLNDVLPRYEKHEAPSLTSPAVQQEVADFYTFHYAAGLDALLETTWYSSQGLAQLQSSSELQDFVAQCVQQFKASADNPAMTNQIRSLEVRLVWQLAKMARSHPFLPDVVARVDTLENLLTGHFLDPSKVPPPPPTTREEDQVEYNRQLFWHNLMTFTTARDDRRDPAAQRQITDSLAVMRRSLNMLENRDVLYSIAIGRHVGGRMPEFHPQRHIVSSTSDAHDEVNKLKVAVHFIQQEDQKGTTQVIQRVCSMALRAWSLQKQ